MAIARRLILVRHCSGWESLSNPDVYLLHESRNGRLAFERLWG